MFGNNKINGNGSMNKLFGGGEAPKKEEAAGDPKEQLQQAIEAIVKQALEQALSGLGKKEG